MRIEIWSDVVCPWCYIGKRRLERALEGFEHREEVEVVWRSFQLDPSAPREATESIAEHLGAKYGGGAEAGRQMIDRVEAVAAEDGLLFRYAGARRANTLDAHRLLHLALEDGTGTQARLKEALLAAYFTQGENVAEHDVLRAAAREVGLDADRVEALLASSEFAEDVERDVREASALGATGVPFYVVDRRYGVSGAQPADVFRQVLDQAWREAHPVLQTVGGAGAADDAEACGPDGCAVS